MDTGRLALADIRGVHCRGGGDHLGVTTPPGEVNVSGGSGAVYASGRPVTGGVGVDNLSAVGGGVGAGGGGLDEVPPRSRRIPDHLRTGRPAPRSTREESSHGACPPAPARQVGAVARDAARWWGRRRSGGRPDATLVGCRGCCRVLLRLWLGGDAELRVEPFVVGGGAVCSRLTMRRASSPTTGVHATPPERLRASAPLGDGLCWSVIGARAVCHRLPVMKWV